MYLAKAAAVLATQKHMTEGPSGHQKLACNASWYTLLWQGFTSRITLLFLSINAHTDNILQHSHSPSMATWHSYKRKPFIFFLIIQPAINRRANICESFKVFSMIMVFQHPRNSLNVCKCIRHETWTWSNNYLWRLVAAKQATLYCVLIEWCRKESLNLILLFARVYG